MINLNVSRRFFAVAVWLFMSFITPLQAGQRMVLVTGFEPFGGDVTNSSWEAVQALDGKHFGDATVVVAQLPVVWGKAEAKLHTLIQTHKPQLLISFGQAGREPVRLETTAHNVRGKIADNADAVPESAVMDALGPATLDSSLPLSGIAEQLRKAGIPVESSDDAGIFLCNAVFYTLMRSPDGENIPRGFIHLPPLNAEVASASGGTILFDKAMLEKTAATIVENSVSMIKNLR
jgi:pyroglutamyl-peptidase